MRPVSQKQNYLTRNILVDYTSARLYIYQAIKKWKEKGTNCGGLTKGAFLLWSLESFVGKGLRPQAVTWQLHCHHYPPHPPTPVTVNHQLVTSVQTPFIQYQTYPKDTFTIRAATQHLMFLNPDWQSLQRHFRALGGLVLRAVQAHTPPFCCIRSLFAHLEQLNQCPLDCSL